MLHAWLLWQALGGLTLISEDCEELDVQLVREELELELEPVLKSSGRAFGVTLSCQRDEIELTVQDPMTAKRVTRSIVDPGSEDPDRERIVALAATRLFTTSWMELTLPELPTPPRPTIVLERPTRPERRAAQTQVQRATPTVRHPHLLGLGIAAGWAGTQRGGPQVGLELQYSYRILPRLELAQALDYGAALAAREPGVVFAGTLLASTGARILSDPWKPNAFVASALFGAGWQDMRGRPRDGGPGGHLGNFALRTQLTAAWRHAGSRSFELGAKAAWNFGGATGRFPGGSVSFAGPAGSIFFRSWWSLSRSSQ